MYLALAVLLLILLFFLYEPLGLNRYNPFAEGVGTGYPRMRCPRFTNWNPATGDCEYVVDTQMMAKSMVGAAGSPLYRAGQLYGY